MQDNDASRIINVVDKRVEKRVGVLGTTETTWGEVCAISVDGKYASAYLYGETEVASENFKIPQSLALSVGDKVKVAWNARGERWVYDVALPGDYKKVAINPNTGEIALGDGTAPPVSIATLFASSGHTHSHDHEDFDRLVLTATDDASLSSTLHALQIGPTGGGNLIFDGNEIMARNNGAAAPLYVNFDGGSVNLGGVLDIGGTSLYLGSDGRIYFGSEFQLLNDSGSTARAIRTGGVYVGPNYGDPSPPTSGIQFGADVGVQRTDANELGMLSGDRFRFKSSGDIANATAYMAALEVFADNGNDAFIEFHVGSDYAFYFGLDGEVNDLRVGGWSLGAAKYSVWSDINRRSFVTSFTAGIPVGATANGPYNINFGGRFNATPMIAVAQASLPGGSQKFIGKFQNASATSVDFYVYMADGTAIGATVNCTWHMMAFQSP